MCMAKKPQGSSGDQSGMANPGYQPTGYVDSLIYGLTKGKHRLNPKGTRPNPSFVQGGSGGSPGPSTAGVVGPSPSYTGA